MFPNSKLVKIYQTSSEIDAIFMKDVLENYGFQTWIQNLEISKILGSGNLSFGSFFLTGHLSIFVLDSDYEEARIVVGFYSVRERKRDIQYEELNLLSILFSIKLFVHSKIFSLINLILSLLLLFGIGSGIYFSEELNLYFLAIYSYFPLFILVLTFSLTKLFRFENGLFGRGLLLLSTLLFIFILGDNYTAFDLFDLFSHRYPLPEK